VLTPPPLGRAATREPIDTVIRIRPPVGTIPQEGQSKARKLLRLVSSVHQFLTHKLAVYDADGTKVLEFVRPAKVFMSTVEVHDAAGAPGTHR